MSTESVAEELTSAGTAVLAIKMPIELRSRVQELVARAAPPIGKLEVDQIICAALEDFLPSFEKRFTPRPRRGRPPKAK